MADPLTLLAFKLLFTMATANGRASPSPGPDRFAPEGPSAPEVAEAVLRCYHPTGRFRTADVVQSPWARGAQYGASRSALLRIDWAGGFVGEHYVTMVAPVARSGMLRAVVEQDTAHVPASATCGLNHWTAVAAAQPPRAAGPGAMPPRQPTAAQGGHSDVDECWQTARAHPDVGVCLNARLKAAEVALADAEAKAAKAAQSCDADMKSHMTEHLAASDTTRQAYRDAECARVREDAWGGTGKGDFYQQCLIDKARGRA